jgi:Plasmid replication region DNA-binding N-term
MTAYIPRAEVHDAADTVNAGGRKPSAKTIRELLGRGSYTTIESHLHTWIPRDQRLELPPVPDGLTATVSSLATDLWHVARSAAQAEAAAQISGASDHVTEARSAAREAGEKADALVAELGAAREQIAKLEKMVAQRDARIQNLEARLRDCEVEDARKAGELDSLQRTIGQFAPGLAAMRNPKIHHASGEQSAA